MSSLAIEQRSFKKAISNILIVAILLIILTLALILSKGRMNPSPYLVMLLLFIGGFSIAEIARDKSDFSLNKMHWYFIFIFMAIAPMIQYLSGYYAGHYYLSDYDYTLGAFIVLLWCATYSIAFRVRTRNRENTYHKPNRVPHQNFIAFTLLSLSAISCLYLTYRIGGFENFFLRGEAWIESTNSIDTVLSYLLRAIPVLSFALLFQLKKNKQGEFSWLYIVALLPMVIVMNYPVSLSRYWSGVVYIGLFLIVLPSQFFKNRRFDFFVLVTICVLFPLLYQLKFITIDEFIRSGIPLFFSNYSDSFNSVDFDAFSLLCRIVQYTNSEGLMLGRQLISVIFFFIPRAILPIKGSPTGSMVASAQGSSFTNLSAPIMAEGYVDFGVLGVILYAVIFARALRWFDGKKWLVYSSREFNLSYLGTIYPFLFGFVFFVMRGALQPAFLRVMGFFLFLIIIYFAQKVFGQKNVKMQNNEDAGMSQHAP